MSFVFDPNENIDRAEDAYDPQDVASYVGGEGLFDRVPPKLEPPIDPRVKPEMVHIKTEAYPYVIKACP
jgi:hypothetical protein